MKTTTLRILIPLIILFGAGVGFTLHTGFGNLSALGWESVSLLCPLGALGTMIASKTIIPRAVISLLIAFVAIVLLGRAFCGWVCPVPVVSKLRTLFAKGQPTEAKASLNSEPKDETNENPQAVLKKKATNASTKARPAALSAKESKLLKSTCTSHTCNKECASANSRYLVLGGALLSTALFGFPVFCLICPIGLSFAFVFIIINLFGAGDVTWSVIAIPIVLLIEVVFFRKWCSHICPISALMSLVGKLNRTVLPRVNTNTCLEIHGIECGKCAHVCEMSIDPRHPERGNSWSECTRCRACVDNCPAHAIDMPLLNTPKKPEVDSSEKSNTAL